MDNPVSCINVVAGETTAAPLGAFKVTPLRISPVEISVVLLSVIATMSATLISLIRVNFPSALVRVDGSPEDNFPSSLKSRKTIELIRGPLITDPEKSYEKLFVVEVPAFVFDELLTFVPLPPAPQAARRRPKGVKTNGGFFNLSFACNFNILKIPKISYQVTNF